MERLHQQYQGVPDEYCSLLAEFGKLTSVCGFLQVQGPEVLETLQVKILFDFKLS